MNSRTIFISFAISLFFYWLNNREKTAPNGQPGTVDSAARDAIKSLDARIKSLENSPFA